MFASKNKFKIIKIFWLRHLFGLSRQRILIILNLFLLGGVSFGCSHFNARRAHDTVCVYTKVAFDVGSGSTKMKVARVDVCKGEVLKVFLNLQIPVAYKENLVKVGKNFKFNHYITKKGFLVLSGLVKRAQKFKPNKFVGVGTSAFRKAINAKDFFKKIKKELNINLIVLTQKEEAQMGFYSAQVLLSKLNKSLVKNKKIIVWDIGGGSMQMLFQEKRKVSNFFLKKWLFYKGDLASINFKKYIIKKIQKKSYKKSPNPMGSLVVKKAEKYSFNYAKNTIPTDLKQIFKQKFLVLGIGGVHYHSVFKQIKSIFKQKNKKFYTKNELQKTLNRRKNLSDKNIGGTYASTDISNLALVLGFMQYLKINKIYTGKINLTNGILLNL